MSQEQGRGPHNEAVDYWLGPESPMADLLPGFAPRTGQREMGRAVARTLRQGLPLLAEAGTGTGKTLAYLIPAVLSGLKVVVSTGTKTLQDQVAMKELPLIREALDPGLSFAVLKGRANYLCLRRYLAFSAQPELGLAGVRTALKLLTTWSRETLSGDLDEVRGEGLSEAVIGEITSDAEQCLGARCPSREGCHLLEARRRAAEARVVVVNHHLFLADLALRAEGHGEALPRWQAAVFDEAHLIPEVATQAFGVAVTSTRLNRLLRDCGREVSPPPAGLAEALSRAHAAGTGLFGAVRRLAGPGGSSGLDPTRLESLAAPGAELAAALEELALTLDQGEEVGESLAGRALSLAADLTAVAQPVRGASVAWVQVRGRSAGLHLSPVEVAPHLQTMLYAEHSRLIFTSATLAPTGDLEPTRLRLGLDSDTLKLVVPSPFDLAEQAVLYVPAGLAPAGSPGFAAAVAQEVEELLKLSGGRAFVLFTSHRNLEAVSGLLAEKLPWPVFIQGQAPRMQLLERFKAQSPSVLFATASFWQGVDVPGEELSAVIVDKLPFAPPDDPLVAARMELIESQGGSGFAKVMLPEAVLALKQGLGRLLRSAGDRGLLAVLDTRLATKGYGRVFLKALAPVPLTRDRAEVARFFGRSG